jgi:hypothetical protein
MKIYSLEKLVNYSFRRFAELEHAGEGKEGKHMLQLSLTGFRWDRDLQIIQADVRMEVEGRLLIDEPLCVDVGMPSLVYSLKENVKPNRWGTPEEWRTKPFFVCGCGDPECRAYSIAVRHLTETGKICLAEVEEREDGGCRLLEDFEVGAGEYRSAVMAAALDFLDFAEGLDGYQPLFPDSLEMIRRYLPR